MVNGSGKQEVVGACTTTHFAGGWQLSQQAEERDPLRYFPIIRIVNEPGTTAPTGPRPLPPAAATPGAGAAGAGPLSCDIVNR